MKLNIQKIFSAQNIAISSFIAIAVTSFCGLGIVHKLGKDRFTTQKWILVVTGSISVVGGCCLADEKSGYWTLGDNQGSRSDDVHIHTHVVWPASFDKNLVYVVKGIEEIAQKVEALDEMLAKQATAKAKAEATALDEQERQSKNNMLAMLRDLGTESDPLEILQRAVQICLDARLWIEPAQAETCYSDTERF